MCMQLSAEDRKMRTIGLTHRQLAQYRWSVSKINAAMLPPIQYSPHASPNDHHSFAISTSVTARQLVAWSAMLVHSRLYATSPPDTWCSPIQQFPLGPMHPRVSHRRLSSCPLLRWRSSFLRLDDPALKITTGWWSGRFKGLDELPDARAAACFSHISLDLTQRSSICSWTQKVSLMHHKAAALVRAYICQAWSGCRDKKAGFSLQNEHVQSAGLTLGRS